MNNTEQLTNYILIDIIIDIGPWELGIGDDWSMLVSKMC